MHKQLAKTVAAFAEQSLECMDAVTISEKVAESWNKYFESGGKTPVLEETKNEKQLSEPELENNLDF